MKKIKINLTYSLLFIGALFLTSCVEEFEISTDTYEQALVVEAVITDELKYQHIKLSNTYTFEEEDASPVENATVKIIDDLDNEYPFEEIEPGNYVSSNVFMAELDRAYKLSIQTNSGKSYLSDATALPQNTSISNFYAEPITNEEGEEGVAIKIDADQNNSNTRYYRYEYEETYKIIAPYWSPSDLVLVSRDPIVIEVVPREQDEEICYKTNVSRDIILENTINYPNQEVDDYQLRFINKKDLMIAHRYSILVRQYQQSLEAHTYYKTLKKFSDRANVFSQIQTGNINGNIYSVNDENEKVVGYFEIAGIDSKRIFFNWEDLYGFEPKPELDCEITAPAIFIDFRTPLPDAIEAGTVRFFDYNTGLYPVEGFQGPYYVVPADCGDCTTQGSNVVPDFWVE